MGLSTMFWRPINLFRGKVVRAKSKHTSFLGLARIYSKNKNLRALVKDNIERRVMSSNESSPTRLTEQGMHELIEDIQVAYRQSLLPGGGGRMSWFLAVAAKHREETAQMREGTARIKERFGLNELD